MREDGVFRWILQMQIVMTIFQGVSAGAKEEGIEKGKEEKIKKGEGVKEGGQGSKGRQTEVVLLCPLIVVMHGFMFCLFLVPPPACLLFSHFWAQLHGRPYGTGCLSSVHHLSVCNGCIVAKRHVVSIHPSIHPFIWKSVHKGPLTHTANNT